MDFIFMLTRNDRTVEDAGCLVDQVCELGVTHIGFKDVGVPAATMRELVGDDPAARRHLLPRGCKYNTRGDAPLAGDRARRSASTGSSAAPTSTRPSASSAICRGYFPFPGRPVGHPTHLDGSAALVAEHCATARRDGLRRRRPARLPGDRGRSARPRARGARRARRAAADRRRQRAIRRRRSTRSPKPAPTRSRSDRRCSTARSRRRRDRSAARSSTSSRPATRRPSWPHEHAALRARAPRDRLPVNDAGAANGPDADAR